MTETADIAAVLDEAARRWPELSRGQLIKRVLLDWARGGQSPSARKAARRALVGSLPGSAELYDRDDDWPA